MTQFKFNVAQLLRENIGSRRDYTFTEKGLRLDETLVLRDIEGSVRFTRTATGVFAQLRTKGLVRLVCVRSLEEFDYPVQLDVHEEMHSIIDVFTGVTLDQPEEDDPFLLTENHMADIGEIVREYALLELPLSPVAEAYRGQPVRYTVQSDTTNDVSDEDADIDARFQVLKTWTEDQAKKRDRNSS